MSDAAEPLEAFGDIVRTHQRMIHALAYRLTGSVHDAEDVAQEVFIRAHRQLADFRGDASVKSWLYRIGVNACLDWRRQRARRRALQEAWSADEQQRLEPARVPPETERVQAALMKLSDKQRAAIVLTVYEEMTHAEAARALGCTEATLSWRVFRARRHLARLLRPATIL